MNRLIVFVFAAVSAFAQQVPTPIGVTTPVGVTTSVASSCAADDDKFWLSELNTGEVREVCVRSLPDGNVFSQVKTIAWMKSVQQIVPVGRDSFYAYSPSGKLHKYVGNINGGSSQEFWRIFGGGYVFDAGNGEVSLRIPWEAEVYRFYLNWGGSVYSQQIFPRDKNKTKDSCFGSAILKPSGREFCLDPQGWLVRGAAMTFAGPDFANSTAYLVNERPVAIASQGEVLYALLGTTYEYPVLPTVGPVAPTDVKLGSLVAMTFDYNGISSMEKLIDLVDVTPDLQNTKLAVTSRRVYFGANDQKGTKKIMYYDLKTKEVGLVVQGKENEFFGTIAAPPQQ